MGDYDLREAFNDLLEYAVSHAVEKHKESLRATEHQMAAQEEVRRRAATDSKLIEARETIEQLKQKLARYEAKFGPAPAEPILVPDSDPIF